MNPSSQWLTQLLNEIDIIQVSQNEQSIRIDIESSALPALLELLRGRASFVHLSAISCVDWIEQNQFELIYHIVSYELNQLISIHTRIDREQAAYVSIYDIFKNAAFYERDIYEMFGLYFEGSPSMEKFILTEWDGPPPMRKDFDSEAWVNQHFNWQDYQPDWLKSIESEGGGIAIYPDEQRFSRRTDET